MSHSSLNPSLRACVAAALFSAVHDAGAHETGVVDMADFSNVQVAGAIGAFGLGASGTVKFEQSKTADFTEAKEIEGRPAVSVVQFKPVVVDLNQGELDINEGYKYVRAVLTVADESVTAGLVVLGFDARHAPAEPMDGVVVNTRAS